jgi:hypothetical protein
LPEASSYSATEKRYSVVLRAELEADGGAKAVSVRVVNISAGGLMAVVPSGTDISGQVTIAIHHLDTLAGTIVWARDGRVGVKFDEAVDPERLMADRAQRAMASARTTGHFVKKSSRIFDELDSDDDVLPFVAMMRSKGLGANA